MVQSDPKKYIRENFVQIIRKIFLYCEVKPGGSELRDSGGHHGKGAHLTRSLTQIKAELRRDAEKRSSSHYIN